MDAAEIYRREDVIGRIGRRPDSRRCGDRDGRRNDSRTEFAVMPAKLTFLVVVDWSARSSVRCFDMRTQRARVDQGVRHRDGANQHQLQ
jgi:hypothetical protein